MKIHRFRNLDQLLGVNRDQRAVPSPHRAWNCLLMSAKDSLSKPFLRARTCLNDNSRLGIAGDNRKLLIGFLDASKDPHLGPD